jgi:hypothetical protein
MTPEQSTTDASSDARAKSLTAVASSASKHSDSIFSRAWSTMRSWFEVPYGYEDETGFHYGEEPVRVQAVAPTSSSPAPFRETFTDTAHGSAMFMAATGGQTAPPPKPEQPKNSEAATSPLKTTPA